MIPRHIALRSLLVATFGLQLVGCFSSIDRTVSATAPRPAFDTPDHFEIERRDRAGSAEPSEDTTCWSPMVDPRDGTRLRLVRSSAGEGDYEVAEPRYGVGPGEALRLDCRTGRVIGIVSRDD